MEQRLPAFAASVTVMEVGLPVPTVQILGVALLNVIAPVEALLALIKPEPFTLSVGGVIASVGVLLAIAKAVVAVAAE